MMEPMYPFSDQKKILTQAKIYALWKMCNICSIIQRHFGSCEEFFSSVCGSLLKKLRIEWWITGKVDWSKDWTW